MKYSHQIFGGILAGVLLALVEDRLINEPAPQVVYWALEILLLLVCLMRGQKLPVFFRALATVLIFAWGYSTCLVGLTMEPGLTSTTIGMAFTFFLMLGIWPGFVLLRLWTRPRGAALLGALFPAAFLLAALVAGTEEYLFVRKYHDTGVGVTPRWTVHNH